MSSRGVPKLRFSGEFIEVERLKRLFIVGKCYCKTRESQLVIKKDSFCFFCLFVFQPQDSIINTYKLVLKKQLKEIPEHDQSFFW